MKFIPSFRFSQLRWKLDRRCDGMFSELRQRHEETNVPHHDAGGEWGCKLHCGRFGYAECSMQPGDLLQYVCSLFFLPLCVRSASNGRSFQQLQLCGTSTDGRCRCKKKKLSAASDAGFFLLIKRTAPSDRLLYSAVL